MTETARRRLWNGLKWGVAIGILVGVGWVVTHNLLLLEGTKVEWALEWLLLSAGLYIAGVAFSAFYWWWAMRSLGQQPGFWASMRAYYIGHLGKYIPGKALVIVMRTAMIQGPAVRTSAAALTVAYEAFTTMAAGALLAVVLIGVRIQSEEGRLRQAFIVLGVAIVPTLPWVFNSVVQRLTARFRKSDATPLPRFRMTTLTGGLVLGLAAWLFLGASLWATVRAVRPYPLGPGELMDCIAYLSIASVVGFFGPTPGGLGVREGVLMELFRPALGVGHATLVAVLLRLTWIAAEVIVSALLYPLPWLWSKKSQRAIDTQTDRFEN